MILTGKARKDFETWLDSDDDNLCGLDLFQLNNTCIYALIIEWFETININIHTDIHTDYYIYKIYVSNLENPDYFEKFYHNITHGFVKNKAIIKANEIYNNLNK